MKWIRIDDQLPEDGKRVFILNLERHPDFSYEDFKTKKEFRIYDGFFEKCRGWVLFNNIEQRIINVCYWCEQSIPEIE